MRITPKTEDLVNLIGSLPATADELRAAEMKRLTETLKAERAALEIETKRVTAKYGENSPQARVMANRMTSLDQQTSQVSKERGDTGREPRPGKSEFVVTGRVVGKKSEAGVAGVAVVAVDAQGNTIAETKTDAQGNYEIRVPVDTPDGEGQAGKVSLNFKLRVGVPGTAATQVETFEPKAGKVAHRDIKVSTEDLPDPPKKA